MAQRMSRIIFIRQSKTFRLITKSLEKNYPKKKSTIKVEIKWRLLIIVDNDFDLVIVNCSTIIFTYAHLLFSFFRCVDCTNQEYYCCWSSALTMVAYTFLMRNVTCHASNNAHIISIETLISHIFARHK